MLLNLINYKFIKYINVPLSGQLGFQNPNTFYMLSVLEFHALVMFYCFIVFTCVSSFLFEIWYLFRDSVSKYPTRRKIRDNYYLERWFMFIPLCIVGILIVPSWALLYASNEPKDCYCIMKAIGSQWQWEYEVAGYPFWVKKGYDWRTFWCCVTEGLKWKTNNISFLEINQTNSLFSNYKYGLIWYSIHKKISNVIFIASLKSKDVLNFSTGYLTYLSYKWNSITLPVEELHTGHYRLLEVSKAVLLPVQQWVRINITATDVIHSWSVPSFGMKIDGVPGRLNMGYLLILHEGLFYGQCSEFCGRDHYRMSIVVKGTDLVNSFN